MQKANLINNDKILDALAVALNEKTRLLVYEGTIRSSKKVQAIQDFHYKLQKCDSYLQAIGSRS